MFTRKLSNEDIVAMAEIMVDDNKTCREMEIPCCVGKSSINNYINKKLENIDSELYYRTRKLMVCHSRISESEKTKQINELNSKISLHEETHTVCRG